MKIEDENIKKIVEKLPDNEQVVKEILSIIKNTTTKLIKDEAIKNSYYVYLNDTIFLSNKEKVIKDVARICLIAHECIHSIQSKKLQKINFIISNLELVSFFIFIILSLSKVINIYYLISYILIVIISIIPRLILETGAVKNSTKLAKKYISKKLSKNEADQVEKYYKIKINRLFPFFIISLVLGKFIRIGSAILLFILINLN